MEGCYSRRRDTAKWVKNQIVFLGQRQHESFDQCHWKLAGMNSLLNVIAVNIWQGPNIFRVFSVGVTRILTFITPLVRPLARILGCDPHRV